MKKYEPLKQFTVHSPDELNGSKHRAAIPLGAELWIKYFTIEYTLEQSRQELWLWLKTTAGKDDFGNITATERVRILKFYKYLDRLLTGVYRIPL